VDQLTHGSHQGHRRDSPLVTQRLASGSLDLLSEPHDFALCQMQGMAE
jgi:hypothetical protein